MFNSEALKPWQYQRHNEEYLITLEIDCNSREMFVPTDFKPAEGSSGLEFLIYPSGPLNFIHNSNLVELKKR